MGQTFGGALNAATNSTLVKAAPNGPNVAVNARQFVLSGNTTEPVQPPPGYQPQVPPMPDPGRQPTSTIAAVIDWYDNWNAALYQVIGACTAMIQNPANATLVPACNSRIQQAQTQIATNTQVRDRLIANRDGRTQDNLETGRWQGQGSTKGLQTLAIGLGTDFVIPAGPLSFYQVYAQVEQALRADKKRIQELLTLRTSAESDATIAPGDKVLIIDSIDAELAPLIKKVAEALAALIGFMKDVSGSGGESVPDTAMDALWFIKLFTRNLELLTSMGIPASLFDPVRDAVGQVTGGDIPWLGSSYSFHYALEMTRIQAKSEVLERLVAEFQRLCARLDFMVLNDDIRARVGAELRKVLAQIGQLESDITEERAGLGSRPVIPGFDGRDPQAEWDATDSHVVGVIQIALGSKRLRQEQLLAEMRRLSDEIARNAGTNSTIGRLGFVSAMLSEVEGHIARELAILGLLDPDSTTATYEAWLVTVASQMQAKLTQLKLLAAKLREQKRASPGAKPSLRLRAAYNQLRSAYIRERDLLKGFWIAAGNPDVAGQPGQVGSHKVDWDIDAAYPAEQLTEAETEQVENLIEEQWRSASKKQP